MLGVEKVINVIFLLSHAFPLTASEASYFPPILPSNKRMLFTMDAFARASHAGESFVEGERNFKGLAPPLPLLPLLPLLPQLPQLPIPLSNGIS